MLFIKNKVSKMDTEKLKKHEIIAKRSVIAGAVIIVVLLVATVLTGAFHVAEDKAFTICVIGSLISLFVWWFLATNYSAIYRELTKRENLGSLSEMFETEKQVNIMCGYHGSNSVLILKNLLKGATITARHNKETSKVILRFEMVDDEGKTFSKTLELDEDRIIYDLEIL